MPDPVTLGGLAVLALSMTAEAMLKGTVGEAAKEAYHALKDKIAQWAASDIAALELTPDSARRQAVIAEEIERQTPDDQANIRSLAIALMDELEKRQRSGPIGIDTDRLEAARIHLKNINVTEVPASAPRTSRRPEISPWRGSRSALRRENRNGSRVFPGCYRAEGHRGRCQR
jgi:hypothetical protein